MKHQWTESKDSSEPLIITSLCITKLDETVKPGKIASVMNEINVPVKALSSGQGIPKDIMLGDSSNVLKSIFDNN